VMCIDPAGIDRTAIHEKAARLALEFFGKHLH